MNTPHPPTLAETLVASQFGVDGSDLVIAGHAIRDLAAQFGTPLFVYDADIMRGQLAKLRDATGQEVDVFYSVKANPNPAVIRVLLDEGAGLEIASGGEYVKARAAGGAADRILFAGPGKTREELEFVTREGIGELHVETPEELAHISEIAAHAGTSVPIALRINPGEEAQGGAMRMGGRPLQFGFDEEDLEALVQQVDDDPNLDLVGIHLFAGTQGLDADVMLRQWAHAITLAHRVTEQTQRPLKTLNFGGGLGVPYFKGDTPLDLAHIAERAPAMFQEMRKSPLLHETRLVLEPGRFLSAPAGIYVTKVLSRKLSRGQVYIIMDGGMHHHLAASGNLGQVIKKDYPLLVANRMDEANDETGQTFVGPLCTPLDTLGRNAMLPAAHPGDYVAVLQSGAYGLTASPQGFLSHPTPAELLVQQNQPPQQITPRGTFQNLAGG